MARQELTVVTPDRTSQRVRGEGKALSGHRYAFLMKKSRFTKILDQRAAAKRNNPSPAEFQMAKIFRMYRMIAERQKVMGNHIVDFYLPGLRTVVERARPQSAKDDARTRCLLARKDVDRVCRVTDQDVLQGSVDLHALCYGTLYEHRPPQPTGRSTPPRSTLPPQPTPLVLVRKKG